MKLFITALVVCAFFSCSKEVDKPTGIINKSEVAGPTRDRIKGKPKDLKKSDLVGHWLLKEVLPAYSNGGSPEWVPVAQTEIQLMQFLPNYKFLRIINTGSSFNKCTGHYYLDEQNLVEITTDCNQDAEILNITELTNKSLITAMQVREGVIYYKYQKLEFDQLKGLFQ